MSPEEIARRFERRAGYELIDYASVALPLFRLTIDAVTMVHAEIPPIKEFAMRSIEAGLSRRCEVAKFLGLDPSTIEATFDQLRNDGYTTDDTDGGIKLAPRGHEVLKKARESTPQDEMLVVLYDRLLQKPLRLSQQLLHPSEINFQKMIEIRPYPAEGPNIEELSIPDVLHVLQEQAGGRASFGRDLLRLKRVVRRVRMFRQGVALVFKKVRASEIQIEFVVDDVRHEGLSHAFAERGGPRKMGFVKSIEESSSGADLRRYLGAEVQQLLPKANDLDSKGLAVSLARIKHRAAVTLAARRLGANGADADAEAMVDAAAENLQRAEDELRSFPARPVRPYEVQEFLDQALGQTRRLLILSSRKLDPSFVDALFLKRVRQLLSGGIRVVITATEPVGTDSAGVELEKLRREHSTLVLKTGRKAQFYHLVSDDNFALVTNRPFLGNLGKVRGFYQTVGYLLQRPDIVKAFAGRLDPTSREGSGS
jgi:hypothetical protein